MKYLSLFSGIGGFELGILNAYVETADRKANRGGKATEKTRGGKGYSQLKSSGPSRGRTSQHNHRNGSRQKLWRHHKNQTKQTARFRPTGRRISVPGFLDCW